MSMKTREEKEAIALYDMIAEEYHEHRTKTNPQGWFFNEFLEMPTTLKILGNVKGKKILDFGCGSGIYAKLLTQKGAIVKGFDISESMLSIARKLNPHLELKRGSGYHIPFTEKFDIVLCSLTLHYMKNLSKVFSEVKRVLKKQGIFIFSIDNPVTKSSKSIIHQGKKYKALGIESYFKDRVRYYEWPSIKGTAKIPVYLKTYGSLIKSIVKNGFKIIDYEDAFPSPKAKKLFPKEYELYSKMPYFCVWKLQKE